MILYCITNTLNGKRYIGITRETAEKRFRRHVRRAGDGNRALGRAEHRAKLSAARRRAKEIARNPSHP